MSHTIGRYATLPWKLGVVLITACGLGYRFLQNWNAATKLANAQKKLALAQEMEERRQVAEKAPPSPLQKMELMTASIALANNGNSRKWQEEVDIQWVYVAAQDKAKERLRTAWRHLTSDFRAPPS